MQIAETRMNTLIEMTVNSAMSVLKVGLPEFNEEAMQSLREEVEMRLSDMIDSHICALTEDEYVEVEHLNPFGDE